MSSGSLRPEIADGIDQAADKRERGFVNCHGGRHGEGNETRTPIEVQDGDCRWEPEGFIR